MPGLVPGIHVFLYATNKDVDGRDKPGHDVYCAAAGIRCSGAWRARRRTEFDATMVRLAA
jgi:hypothetical protein